MSKPILVPRPMFLHEFEPLVGHTFLADCDPRPAELVLAEAYPATKPIKQITKPQFTLIFKSKPSILLVGGIYTMRCGQFGPFALYLEPTVAPPEGAEPMQYYQAIFN